MTRIILAFALVLALTACQKEALPNAATEITPGGISYTFVKMDDQKDVAVQIAWPTDWGWRGGNNQTVPYVGADLILSGGAKGYAAGEVVELFADLKAQATLSTTVDQIYGQLIFEKANIDEPVKIANAHLLAPTLDEAWFERIRDQWKKKIAENLAQPQTMGFTAIRDAVFGDQPIRAAISLDQPEMFDTLNLSEISIWHKETFTRKPDAIVVAGEISVEQANQIVDGLFAGLPEGGRSLTKAATANFKPRRILLHVPMAKTANLSFIGQMPPTRGGKEFEDIMLIQALGGDDQSPLFTAVRTGLRASYGYSSGLDGFSRDNRFMVMTGEVDVSKLAEAETIVRKTYGEFLLSGPSGDISLRTPQFSANLKETLEHCDSMAFSVLVALLDGFPASRILGLQSELERITTESLKERLETAFPRTSELLMVAVSPDANALPGACVITSPQEASNCQ